jgi:hypothetical protein
MLWTVVHYLTVLIARAPLAHRALFAFARLAKMPLEVRANPSDRQEAQREQTLSSRFPVRALSLSPSLPLFLVSLSLCLYIYISLSISLLLSLSDSLPLCLCLCLCVYLCLCLSLGLGLALALLRARALSPSLTLLLPYMCSPTTICALMLLYIYLSTLYDPHATIYLPVHTLSLIYIICICRYI